MNILVINPILFTHERGVIPHITTIKETMIYDLCRAFHRAGHTVTLMAAADYAPVEREEYEFEVVFLKSVCHKAFPPSVFPFMPSAWSYLRRRKKDFDMVLTSETFTVPSLMAAMVMPRKTVIWQELGAHNSKLKTLPSRFWYNVVAPCLMRRSWVIPRSYVSKRFISRYMPHVGEPIGHGVKTEWKGVAGAKKNQLLSVGRLVPGKNLVSVFKKFDTFLTRYPQYSDYRLYIAGDGELREELTQEIKTMKREDSIILLGKLSHQDLFRYYGESKISLFDSFRENNMLSIMESIVMNTPVITNRVPFNSDDVEVNQLGIAKDNWNEEDIAHVIEHNEEYVARCEEYASLISVDAVARRLIESFENRK